MIRVQRDAKLLTLDGNPALARETALHEVVTGDRDVLARRLCSLEGDMPR
jgi:hypothetical protein